MINILRSYFTYLDTTASMTNHLKDRSDVMQNYNPAGTNGFDFLEFTTTDLTQLDAQFKAMGFVPVAQHHTAAITLYQQNEIQFIINASKNSPASRFAQLHGASTCAMGFRVENAKQAFDYAVAKGGRAFEC